MNNEPPNDTDYYAGKGCQCCAKSEIECSCNVDWTDPRIYDLQKKLKEARKEAEKWHSIANDCKWPKPILLWKQ